MPREAKELSARKVESLARVPGLHALGNNLYLRVAPKTAVHAKAEETTASFVLRYMLDGNARSMGLGSYRKVRLATARARALDALEQKTGGNDPLDAREAHKAALRAEAAKAITFREAAAKYIEAHRAGWKNPKHAAQWSATLESHVYPLFGDLPVAAIDKALVTKALDPIWHKIPETANRVRGRIESVLAWATAKGHREGENPARWKGQLEYAYPARATVQKVQHHPALPYEEIPEFMAGLQDRESVSAHALEFAILTAARTGAVIGATWQEIDLDAKVWTVPPERAGSKITGEHPKHRRVPLVDRAVKILKALPRQEGNPYVFIGGVPRHGLSNMAMLQVMRDLRPGYVPHGFRSTFKDWCSEQTSFPNEVSEAALWHAVADKVEAAYRRGELFDKRRKLMDAWAAYCASPARDGNVVPLRAAE
ncbi:MAG TPA: site-specific integrase [Rhizomicrobium sp.]|jgi:integrase|nr:site-specific integrase [Rhizomicrobium sp.]